MLRTAGRIFGEEVGGLSRLEYRRHPNLVKKQLPTAKIAAIVFANDCEKNLTSFVKGFDLHNNFKYCCSFCFPEMFCPRLVLDTMAISRYYNMEANHLSKTLAFLYLTSKTVLAYENESRSPVWGTDCRHAIFSR
jgi:hypothetical protein